MLKRAHKASAEKANALIDEAICLLNTIKEEREEYQENKSEKWRESERAEIYAMITDAVSSAVDALESLQSDVYDIINNNV